MLRPLPAHLPESDILRALPRLKDVEAQHPENAGLLALGTPRFTPSTAAAAFHMLDRYMASVGRDPAIAYDGLDLVVVGRSTNVGKPAAILGLARNATVISAHKHTADAGRLAEHTRMADLLVVAAGVPGLITGGFVREGAIVVDIGINAVPGPGRRDPARRRRRHGVRAPARRGGLAGAGRRRPDHRRLAAPQRPGRGAARAGRGLRRRCGALVRACSARVSLENGGIEGSTE